MPEQLTLRELGMAAGVPAGILEKASKRGGVRARFFCIRDSMLLCYEAGKAVREYWEAQLSTALGAGRGGWIPEAEGGRWLLETEDEIWRMDERLCAALDAYKPRAVLPLVGSTVHLLEEERFGIVVRHHRSQYKLYCSSDAEQAAWFHAMVGAQDLSASNLLVEMHAKEHAFDERDEARQRAKLAEEDAAEASEEARVHKAAVTRFREKHEELQQQWRALEAECDEEERRTAEICAQLDEATAAREAAAATLRLAEARRLELIAARDGVQQAVERDVQPRVAKAEQKARDAEAFAAAESARVAQLTLQLRQVEEAVAVERARANALAASREASRAARPSLKSLLAVQRDAPNPPAAASHPLVERVRARLNQQPSVAAPPVEESEELAAMRKELEASRQRAERRKLEREERKKQREELTESAAHEARAEPVVEVAATPVVETPPPRLGSKLTTSETRLSVMPESAPLGDDEKDLEVLRERLQESRARAERRKLEREERRRLREAAEDITLARSRQISADL
ncbi:hypothetical protein AB1Y20_015014 [Prymnesium parvum]|uniref:PH domain-containing protein n=1 Tax=Prymnesium parvum TaxID=97485 RepID=A0AB34JWK2_PRYPA